MRVTGSPTAATFPDAGADGPRWRRTRWRLRSVLGGVAGGGQRASPGDISAQFTAETDDGLIQVDDVTGFGLLRQKFRTGATAVEQSTDCWFTIKFGLHDRVVDRHDQRRCRGDPTDPTPREIDLERPARRR